MITDKAARVPTAGPVRRPSAPDRFPVGRARAGGGAQLSTIKAIVILTLSIRGLIGVINDLGGPWRHLIEALLLAFLALAFLAAARSRALRFGWLLSASAATGLAIAASYRFVSTASTARVAATGAGVLLAILLISACGSARAR